MNLLNCSTIEIDSSLGNYYIQCKKEIVLVRDEQGTSTERVYRLYLYNQLSDTSEYDLDTSNVKKVPLKLFLVYKIYLYRHNEIELETKLNNFICAKDFKDPYSFDIGAYMGKNENNEIFSFSRGKYIKYSDHFFTFYFNNSKTKPEIINGIIRLDFIYSEKFEEYLLVLLKVT